jgi:tetratricopeptide (TPR) repeat protein
MCAVAICIASDVSSTRAAAVSYEAARDTALAYARRHDGLNAVNAYAAGLRTYPDDVSAWARAGILDDVAWYSAELDVLGRHAQAARYRRRLYDYARASYAPTALANATRLALAHKTNASFNAYDAAMHPGGPSSSIYPRGAYEDTGAEARFESGLSAGSDGRLTAARADFASAVRSSPEFAQAWLLLGVSDYLAHDLLGARRAWNSALLARGTAMPGSRPPIDPTTVSASYLLLKT